MTTVAQVKNKQCLFNLNLYRTNDSHKFCKYHSVQHEFS